MPSTFLGYPFDPEIFLMNWQAAEDPVLTAIIDSGAVQTNSEIAKMISGGSNVYTIPFYNVLKGDDDNYDGQTDITVTEPDGGSQSGVVYGRGHAWKDRDFIHDFNSGANPMQQISSQVAKYWHKKRQHRLVGLVNGVFSVTDDETPEWDEWQMHTLDISTKSASANEANEVDVASAADATQKAVGDNSGIFSMAIMHSLVAKNLAKKQLLQFRKYTDPNGVERQLNIADWNGYTVLVDDGVHTATNTHGGSGIVDYTTYLFGTGAIQYAKTGVQVPVETDRVTLTQGGYNILITRLRETLHPNGFSFILPERCISPTDVELATAKNWKLARNPKNIAMARIISNG